MKPAWDQLAEAYEGSSVLVGDVDCTVEKDLCSEKGVQGYPTIKYYTAETGEEGEKYQGGRDFDVLKQFVVDTLEVKCDIDTPSEGCSEKEQSFLEKVKTKSDDFIKSQLTRLEGMSGSKMKADLKKWLNQRLNILKQLVEKQEL
jgi:protein disulfide-isomerase A6